VSEPDPSLPRLDAATLDELRSRPRPVLADLSVVIPTLGRPILESSLACIARGDAWPAEILVVDQGTNPDVPGFLTRLSEVGLPARHVASTRRGRAIGLNLGFANLGTERVAVTDDDCLAEPDWLRRMHAALRSHGTAIVSGRVEAAGAEAVVALVTDREPAIYRKPRLKFDAMSGGNMGTSRDVLRRVGPFDEDPRIALSEDGEWCYRALRAGVPVAYAPDVAVRHYGWRGTEARGAQYRAYARSHGAFYAKYLRRGDGFIALRAALHLLRAARRWGLGALRGDADGAARGRAYALGLLPGIVAALRGPR